MATKAARHLDPRSSQTLALAAAQADDVVLLNRLANAGFDVEAPLLDGDTLLLIAARMNASNCVKWLMEAGAVFNPDLAPSGTALIAAAAHDALRCAAVILECAGQVEGQAEKAVAMVDSAGNTAVHIAASRGASDVVTLLLKHGPGAASMRNRAHQTALHLACLYRDASDSGQYNSTGSGRYTSLSRSAKTGPAAAHGGRRLAVVAALLAVPGGRQAVGWGDATGESPLHYAAAAGDLPTVQALVAAGARGAIRSAVTGRTAYDVAVEGGHDEVAAFLAGIHSTAPFASPPNNNTSVSVPAIQGRAVIPSRRPAPAPIPASSQAIWRRAASTIDAIATPRKGEHISASTPNAAQILNPLSGTQSLTQMIFNPAPADTAPRQPQLVSPRMMVVPQPQALAADTAPTLMSVLHSGTSAAPSAAAITAEAPQPNILSQLVPQPIYQSSRRAPVITQGLTQDDTTASLELQQLTVESEQQTADITVAPHTIAGAAEPVAFRVLTASPDTTSASNGSASASAETPSLAAVEELLAPYLKMKRVGVPLPAIRIKMGRDGLTAAQQDACVSALESKTAAEAVKLSSTAATAETSASSSPSPSNEIETDSGVTNGSASADGPSTPSASGRQSTRVQVLTPNTQPKAAPPSEAVIDAALDKYVKLKKIGMPLPAIRKKMEEDGVPVPDQKKFFLSLAGAAGLASVGLNSPAPSTVTVAPTTTASPATRAAPIVASTPAKTVSTDGAAAAAVEPRTGARRMPASSTKLHWETLQLSGERFSQSVWAAATEEGGEMAETVSLTDDDCDFLASLLAPAAPATSTATKARTAKKALFASPLGATAPPSGTMDGPRGTVSMLDAKRQSNLNISLAVFRKFPSKEAILKAVMRMDTSQLSRDMLEALLSMKPTDIEARALRGYAGDQDALVDIDRFLLLTLAPSRFYDKVAAFLTSLGFEESATTLLERTDTFIGACEQVRTSTRLRTVLAAILTVGNVLNSHAPQARAIKLDSLLKLSATKGGDRKTSLMDALVRLLQKKEKPADGSATAPSHSLLRFYDDLSLLEPAARIDVPEARSAIVKLLADLRAAEAEGAAEGVDLKAATAAAAPEPASMATASPISPRAAAVASTPGAGTKLLLERALAQRFASSPLGSPGLTTKRAANNAAEGVASLPYSAEDRSAFVAAMTAFAGKATGQAKLLSERPAALESASAQLAEYFGEDARTPAGKVLGVLKEFIAGFKASVTSLAAQAAAEAAAAKRRAAKTPDASRATGRRAGNAAAAGAGAGGLTTVDEGEPSATNENESDHPSSSAAATKSAAGTGSKHSTVDDIIQ